MSRFPRRALLIASSLLAAVVALTFVADQQFSATATGEDGSIVLGISGKPASCDSFSNPTKCSVEEGGEFTVAVAVESLPVEAGGYVGFQSLLYYGEIQYKPNADPANEIVWPASALPLRSPASPDGDEGIVGHAALSAQTPPLVVSDYLGNVMQLRLTCTETEVSFKLYLIAHSADQPLGTGFQLDEEDGGTIPPKISGQAVLDLDGNPETDAQTVDIADSVEINCSGATPTPVPPNPDLIIQGMAVTLEGGNACDFTSTTLGIRVGVANIGTVDAGPFEVDVNGARMLVEDGLAVDEKTSLWFIGFNSGENSAFVDPTGQVTEMDEGNNGLTQIVPIPTLPSPCTATPTSTLTPTPIGVPGDVDCSGAVTAIDAALVLQFIAALTDTLPCEQLADVNRNGAVDAIDVTLILQFTAGLLGSLGPTQPTATETPTTAPPTNTPAPPTSTNTAVPPTFTSSPEPQAGCHPSYVGVCLDPDAEDYDCLPGDGDGPGFVQPPFQVIGEDKFDLDPDEDGRGCESGLIASG